MREKNNCPKFCKCVDLKFLARYRAECYIPRGSGIYKYFDENFEYGTHFVQSWPVLGVAITAIS